MADIVFLDATTPYNGLVYRQRSIGGVQSGTVELAEAFAKAGHRTTVFNLTEHRIDFEGVQWRRLSEAGGTFDLAIANNRASLLAGVTAPRR